MRVEWDELYEIGDTVVSCFMHPLWKAQRQLG